MRDEANDGIASFDGPFTLPVSEVIDLCENYEGLAGLSKADFEFDLPRVAG